MSQEGVLFGWDGAGARVVFIDRASRATHAWNGKACIALGYFPDAIQGWPWTTFQAPRTSALTWLTLLPAYAASSATGWISS